MTHIWLKQLNNRTRCITLVQQVVGTGCGIACLAMLTCQSYETVKDTLSRQCNWGSKKKELRTHASDLIAYLHNHSVITAVKATFPGWERFQGTGILGVNRNSRGYHWVIVIRTDSNFLIIDPAEAEVYQGTIWIDDEEDGYVADVRSAYVKLTNFSATHIWIE